MNLESLIISFIAAFIQALATTVVIFKQIDARQNSDKLKFFVLTWMYGILTFFFITNQLRMILFIVIISLILYFVLNIKDKSVILYSFNTEIILAISEILSTLILVLLGIKSTDIVNNHGHNLVVNILISIITIIIIHLPVIKLILKKIINLFKRRTGLINYLYVFLLILYLIVSKNGLELILKSNYYINILFVIGIVVIFGIIIRNESKYDQLKEENKQMYNHVTKYEKIITEQGKANHEFKNQLMVIRGYAQMNSDKLLEYIDAITLDANKTHSSYLISQLNKFPEGGIKGLLYYKLSIMDDEKIKYELDVESGVKTKLNTLSIGMYKNITRILGVLLDNAIDASKKSKKKQIVISVSKDKSKVIFTISNTFKGRLNIEKIGTGYTSKGIGHGYGLRLVNDILNETNSFEIKNSVDNNYFVSTLKIKINKKRKNNKKPDISK